MEFCRILLNIMDNMMKKVNHKHIINGKKVQIYDIKMEYQLQKTFMILYIGNRMILCGLLLNIISKCMTLVNIVFTGFFTKTHRNENIKYRYKNVDTHTETRKENKTRIICVGKYIF